jgi:hypothetical protein
MCEPGGIANRAQPSDIDPPARRVLFRDPNAPLGASRASRCVAGATTDSVFEPEHRDTQARHAWPAPQHASACPRLAPLAPLAPPPSAVPAGPAAAAAPPPPLVTPALLEPPLGTPPLPDAGPPALESTLPPGLPLHRPSMGSPEARMHCRPVPAGTTPNGRAFAYWALGVQAWGLGQPKLEACKEAA